jgi:hypothetical protein
MSVHLICASSSLRLESRIVPGTPSSLEKKLASEKIICNDSRRHTASFVDSLWELFRSNRRFFHQSRKRAFTPPNSSSVSL